ncbi:MAG TPA: hypothetical protein GX715_17510 [Armatimonadetes bacterium]|jgi:hypothetical protein|nr:hypothetical protein [Armatimonadota bacterium]
MASLREKEQEVAQPQAGAGRAITGRAVLISLVITFLTGFWVRESELEAVGVFISESVPTIPAVGSILLLLLVNYFLRHTRHAFSRGELIATFFLVTVATTPYNCGMVRILLAFITAPFYFAEAGNRLGEVQPLIPAWSTVRDPEVVRGFYEGLRHAPIPWGAWVVPVLAWVGFFAALWVAMACLVALMHRPWVEKEKLAFPLVQLPLEMTEPGARGGGVPAFFRNPVMWAGFAVAFIADGSHILHALIPSFPHFGGETSFRLFGTPPWNAIGTVSLPRRPLLIGLGYLVSTEITFSVWATFWVEKLVAVFLSAVGYREPGAPFVREQGFGAYLAVALALLYLNRRHLAAIARASTSSAHPEMRGYRVAFWGFWASVAALLVFCRMLGLAWWVGALYMGIILAIALTFARIRAEAGIPLAWLFPYAMPRTMLLSSFGTAPFSVGGDPATLTAFATLSFLSYSNTISLSGYQVESLRAGFHLSEKPGRIMAWLTAAFLVGLILSFAFHLGTFYRIGAGSQASVYGTGFYGSSGAIAAYNGAILNASAPLPIDKPRVVAGSSGFVIALLLQVLRVRIIGFPFHPLGFAAGNSYGHLLWWSFFLVWVIKVAVLRFGGRQLYRKSVPAFLGFTLGHFFTSGVVWGLMGASSKDLFERFIVCFG